MNNPSLKIWTDLVQYLPVESLLKYCSSDPLFAHICNDDIIWALLIQRDFELFYTGDDAREKYFEIIHTYGL